MVVTQRHGSILATIAVSVLAACVHHAEWPAVPPHAVIGVRDDQLRPEFWIARDSGARKVVLDAHAIAEQNSRLMQLDSSVHDLGKLPATLGGADVKGWIGKISEYPDEALFGIDGRQLGAAEFDTLAANLAIDAIPETQPTRYGLVVKRADLRAFPSLLRAYRSPDDHDIDRFQETALFPGTPVVIAHASRDGRWWFVVSPLYAAWVEQGAIAEGPAQDVFAYTRKTPYLVITGATAKTVYTPEAPGVSGLQLDMGVRVPLLADWPQSKTVNGQHPYTAHVIELPERTADGSLRFTPALLPRTADTSSDYLPLSRANILRQ